LAFEDWFGLVVVLYPKVSTCTFGSEFHATTFLVAGNRAGFWRQARGLFSFLLVNTIREKQLAVKG
jgi:hypothetical protein